MHSKRLSCKIASKWCYYVVLYNLYKNITKKWLVCMFKNSAKKMASEWYYYVVLQKVYKHITKKWLVCILKDSAKNGFKMMVLCYVIKSI